MNDQLDDRSMDGKKSHRVDLSIDPECYVLVGRYNYALDDRNLDASSDVNRGHRMSDLLDDHSMDDDHRDVLVGHCNYALDDQNLDVMKVVNPCHRTNDLLGDLNSDDVRRDRNLDGMTDGNLCHRMNDLLGDLMTGVSRVNRKYVRHDLKLVAKMDGKSHHVK
jgi:hypothetical protein